MATSREQIEELKAQLESHGTVCFMMEEQEGDHYEVVITDVQYNTAEDEVLVYLSE